MKIRLHQMEQYQKRMAQLRRHRLHRPDHPMASEDQVIRIAYDATEEAWGALIWHLRHLRRDLSSGEPETGEE